MSQHDERELRVFHEAGHVIGFLAGNGRVERVDLTSVLPALHPALEPRDEAVAYLAGAVCARRFGPARLSIGRDHSKQDLERAAEVLGHTSLPAHMVNDLEREAEAVLLANDGAVRRVAQALRAAGELSGEEVMRLCSGEAVSAVLGSRSPSVPTPTARARAAAPVRDRTPAPARASLAPECFGQVWQSVDPRDGWFGHATVLQGSGAFVTISHLWSTGRTAADARAGVDNQVLDLVGHPVALEVVTVMGRWGPGVREAPAGLPLRSPTAPADPFDALPRPLRRDLKKWGAEGDARGSP